MLIDNFDIKECSAKQFNVKVGHHDLSNESEWISSSPIPVFFNNKIGFKTISVTLVVKGKDREEIINNRSDILSRLLYPVTLTLDGFTHKFQAVLSKQNPTESSLNRFHALQLDFIGYEFEEEVCGNFTQTAAITVNNPGNIETPATLEITPTLSAASITIDGISRDPETKVNETVTIYNLTAGKTIVIDAETGIITENGLNKFKDIDIWQLPSLIPGNNVLTFSADKINVTIKYKPRFI